MVRNTANFCFRNCRDGIYISAITHSKMILDLFDDVRPDAERDCCCIARSGMLAYPVMLHWASNHFIWDTEMSDLYSSFSPKIYHQECSWNVPETGSTRSVKLSSYLAICRRFSKILTIRLLSHWRSLFTLDLQNARNYTKGTVKSIQSWLEKSTIVLVKTSIYEVSIASDETSFEDWRGLSPFRMMTQRFR